MSSQLQMALDIDFPALQTYAVRVSPRSRNVYLRIVAGEGLEVVIPKRFNRRRIPEIIMENRSWIETQLAQMDTGSDWQPEPWPPRLLDLRATGEKFQLEFADGRRRRNPTARLSGERIFLDCDPANRRQVSLLVGSVLKSHAKGVLQPLVSDATAQFGIQIGRLSVRGQRTRWGSMSTTGTLSLNFKLLFLPAEFVRYVILHELAHTRHMNHSSRFWSYLTTLEPDARRLDRELGKVGEMVPGWLDY